MLQVQESNSEASATMPPPVPDGKNLEDRYSPEDFYNFGISGLERSAIAEQIGSNSIGISSLFKRHPQYRDAYEKGIKKLAFEDTNDLTSVMMKDVEKTQNRNAALEDKILAAVEKKLFFIPDIAGFVGESREKVYKSLSSLVSDKILIRDISEGLISYRLADQLTAEEMSEEILPNFADIEDVPEDFLEKIEYKNLNAIDENFCTLPQIKRHAKIPKKFDLSIYLDHFIAAEKINYIDNGNITGFFRYEKMPLRFWLDGAKCFVEYPDPKKKEIPSPRIGEIVTHIPNSAMPDSHKFSHGRKEIDISTDELEELASRGLSVKEAAEELEISYSTLSSKLQQKPMLKKAWETGKNLFDEMNIKNGIAAENDAPEKIAQIKTARTKIEKKKQKTEQKNEKPETAQPKTVDTAIAEIADKLPPTFAAYDFFRLGKDGFTFKDIARLMQILPSEVNKLLSKNPEIREQYVNGKNEFLAANPAKIQLPPAEIESTTETLSEPAKPKRHTAFIPVSREQIFEAAKSSGSMQKAAKVLNISVNTLMRRLNSSDELNEAWVDGRQIYDQNKPPKKSPTRSAKKYAGRGTKKSSKYNAEVFGEFGRGGFNISRIAEKLSVTPGAISQQLQKPDFREAYEKGLEIYKNNQISGITQPEPTETANVEIPAEKTENIIPVNNRADALPAEIIPRETKTVHHYFVAVRRKKRKILPKREFWNTEILPPLRSRMINHKTVVLSNGNRFITGFEGNFFDLSSDERALINGIAEIIQAYAEDK